MSTLFYRVRLPDNSPDSQIGCFTIFENAKLMADANPGYCVFVDGERLYPSEKSVDKELVEGKPQ